MVHKVAWVLLIVGGLNWLLVGAVEVDLVRKVFGAWPILVKLVYILVGLSALYELAMCKKEKEQM